MSDAAFMDLNVDYSLISGGADAAKSEVPAFDVSGFLSGVETTFQGAVTAKEGKANTALYEKYLQDFPQYAEQTKNAYKTKENQTLGDRLAAMAARGIQTGGAGAPTSAATAYSSEQSAYEAGYTTLTNELDLQKTEAEGKLSVAQAQTTAGTVQEVVGGAEVGAAIGSIFGPVGTAIGAGLGAIGGWLASLF